jgi:hypothetical protein
MISILFETADKCLSGAMSEARPAWLSATVLTLLLIAQFLQSLEMFTTLTMFSAIALAFGYILTKQGTDRARILSLLKLIALSYSLALVVVSPYLYYFLAFGFTSKPIWPPSFFNTDLLNFIIPTQTNENRPGFLAGIYIDKIFRRKHRRERFLPEPASYSDSGAICTRALAGTPWEVSGRLSDCGLRFFTRARVAHRGS